MFEKARTFGETNRPRMVGGVVVVARVSEGY